MSATFLNERTFSSKKCIGGRPQRPVNRIGIVNRACGLKLIFKWRCLQTSGFTLSPRVFCKIDFLVSGCTLNLRFCYRTMPERGPCFAIRMNHRSTTFGIHCKGVHPTPVDDWYQRSAEDQKPFKPPPDRTITCMQCGNQVRALRKKSMGENLGRVYFRCPWRGCDFFRWGTTYHHC